MVAKNVLKNHIFSHVFSEELLKFLRNDISLMVPMVAEDNLKTEQKKKFSIKNESRFKKLSDSPRVSDSPRLTVLNHRKDKFVVTQEEKKSKK